MNEEQMRRVWERGADFVYGSEIPHFNKITMVEIRFRLLELILLVIPRNAEGE